MIASTGAPGGNVYASRLLTRFGTVRPAERGSTMSTYATTLDDTAMLVVGPPPPNGRIAAASASPLSVRSSFPPPLTTREVSVTSAVKAFVITRS